MYKSLMIQSSIYRTETGNTFARITTDAQICTNFCKALQGSSLKTIWRSVQRFSGSHFSFIIPRGKFPDETLVVLARSSWNQTRRSLNSTNSPNWQQGSPTSPPSPPSPMSAYICHFPFSAYPWSIWKSGENTFLAKNAFFCTTAPSKLSFLGSVPKLNDKRVIIQLG